MTERKHGGLPTHVLVMLSASTATYALALAVVAGAQSRAEAAVAAVRKPLAGTVEQLSVSQDALGARLDHARSAFGAAAGAYAAVGDSVSALHGQLGDLATIVAEIAGASRSLPASVRLPVVRGSVAGGGAPTTHATTRASGG